MTVVSGLAWREQLGEVVRRHGDPRTGLVHGRGDATVREVWIGYRPRDEAEMAAAIVRLLKEVP